MSDFTLVGVTQRVVDVPSRSERRDVLDQAWAPFLAACGIEMIVVPNRLSDPAGYLRRLGATGVVLTGGGNISSSLGTLDGAPVRVPKFAEDLAPERDITETSLLRASVEEGWPVIGVCRGMQALNLFHGGSLAAVPGHSGTRHRLTRVGTGAIGSEALDDHVNSFHDFGVPPEGVGQGLMVLAEADGWPEVFEGRRFLHLGIMWHPERNRPPSHKDIRLFGDFLRRRRGQLDSDPASSRSA